MLPVIGVAEYFINKATLDEDIITNLKLQKLLYYSQGFSLALLDEALFNELIEKWTHGPVVPDAYHAYKEFGGGAISTTNKFDIKKYEDKHIELLDEVYSVYGQFSAWALRDMTHSEPPWINTPDGQEITQKIMKEYFKTRIK